MEDIREINTARWTSLSAPNRYRRLIRRFVFRVALGTGCTTASRVQSATFVRINVTICKGIHARRVIMIFLVKRASIISA